MTMRTVRQLPRLRSIASTVFRACLSGVVGLGAAALAAHPAVAGDPPETSPADTFSDSADVRIVEVPVQVIRGGQPVRGLTAADFTVWAGKQKQSIVGFETIDVDALDAGAAPAMAPLPTSGRRHFLFLFDLSYSDPHALVRAQQAALQIAREDLRPSDLAGVGVFSPTHGARLVLAFTPDRAQLELALSTLGSTELIQRRPDYLGLLIGQARDALEVKQQAHGKLGGNAVVEMAEKVLNDTLTLDSMHERDLATADRDRVHRFNAGLADLATVMEQVQGRKQVILLSRGFDASLFTGQQQVEGRKIESADEEMREIVRTDSDRRWGNTRLQGELRKTLEQMRRSNCVVHTIDISGAEVVVRGIAGEAADVAAERPTTGKGSESLFVIAEETGGTFHANFNDAGAAMRQVLKATSVTYLLTIQPGPIEWHDRYVPLRVEVRGAKASEVSARPGYFTLPPLGAQAAMQERLRIGSEVMEGRAGGQVHTATLGVPLGNGNGGGPTACAVVEVDGTSLLEGNVGDMVSAEVTVYAFDKKGSIAAVARQLVGMDLSVVGAKLRASGFKLFAGLELGAGEYELRALVRNTVSNRYGIAVAPLVLPPREGQATLAGVFIEPPGRDWLLVRDSGAAQPLVYPFTLGEKVVVPAAAPHLHTGQPATLWVEAPSGAAGLEVVVKRADGGVAATTPLQLGERTPDAATERLLATFSPAGLHPGGYTLEVRVAGANGTASTAPFTVE